MVDTLLSTSALGVRDGNVYEALWNRAQTEPLNESDIPSGYEVGRATHYINAVRNNINARNILSQCYGVVKS